MGARGRVTWLCCYLSAVFPGRAGGRPAQWKPLGSLSSQSLPVAQLCITCRVARVLLPHGSLLNVRTRSVVYLRFTVYHRRASAPYYYAVSQRVHVNASPRIDHEVPRICGRRDERGRRCTPLCWYAKFCVQAAEAAASLQRLESLATPFPLPARI